MDLLLKILEQYSVTQIIGGIVTVLGSGVGIIVFITKFYVQHRDNVESIKNIRNDIENLSTDFNTHKVEIKETTAREREHFLSMTESLRSNMHEQLSEFKQDFGTAIAAIKTSTDLTHERMDKIIFSSLLQDNHTNE